MRKGTSKAKKEQAISEREQVKKGTSKAKKEQAIGYWFSPWSQKQTVKPTR